MIVDQPSSLLGITFFCSKLWSNSASYRFLPVASCNWQSLTTGSCWEWSPMNLVIKDWPLISKETVRNQYHDYSHETTGWFQKLKKQSCCQNKAIFKQILTWHCPSFSVAFPIPQFAHFHTFHGYAVSSLWCRHWQTLNLNATSDDIRVTYIDNIYFFLEILNQWSNQCNTNGPNNF